ncbi:MAG: hypothetical protein RL766_448, partial [Bacteroidota bacterium]
CGIVVDGDKSPSGFQMFGNYITHGLQLGFLINDFVFDRLLCIFS